MPSPETIETWVPALTLLLALGSYALHRLISAAHPMTLRETFANMGIFLVWRFGFFVGGLALQVWVYGLIASKIPWKLPNTVPAFLFIVFFTDFLYYWRHRLEHEWSILWAQHHVHHSSEEFNLSTSLRLPWLGSYLNWPFLIPSLLIGASATQLILAYQVILTYQYLVHTEFVGRLGPLEHILNTPSHHRVHHGRNDLYLDKNYGGIQIIWDRVFGTFRPESIPADFGTTDPMTSRNPIVINFKPWQALGRELAQVPTWTGRARALFKGPGKIRT